MSLKIPKLWVLNQVTCWVQWVFIDRFWSDQRTLDTHHSLLKNLHEPMSKYIFDLHSTDNKEWLQRSTRILIDQRVINNHLWIHYSGSSRIIKLSWMIQEQIYTTRRYPRVFYNLRVNLVIMIKDYYNTRVFGHISKYSCVECNECPKIRKEQIYTTRRYRRVFV